MTKALEVRTKGIPAAKRKVSRVLSTMNPRTANKAASVLLDRWVQTNFRLGGRLAGGWKPFKRGGRIKKGQFDPSAKLLQDTGDLRKSFLPFFSSRAAGIGSRLPYAKTHQRGTKNLPARRMLPKPMEVQGQLNRLYGKHVRTSLRA